MRFWARFDALSAKAIAVLGAFGMWLAIMTFGLYGYGLKGLRAGLDPSNYHSQPVEFAIRSLLAFGPPLAAALLAGSAWLKRR